MGNENYDLIHADDGVELKWNEEGNALTVSGSGRCELGEVGRNLWTEGAVEVTAETVGGNAVSYGQSTLTAETVGGYAWSRGGSKLTAEMVRGDAVSWQASKLTAETVGGYAVSDGKSKLTAETVEGEAESWNESTLTVGGERKERRTMSGKDKAIDNTYWNNKGLFRQEAIVLEGMIPATGTVPGADSHSRHLDQFRRAANAYYDLYNNGGGGRIEEIGDLFQLQPEEKYDEQLDDYIEGEEFDLDKLSATDVRSVEQWMDRYIQQAFREQALRAFAKRIPELEEHNAELEERNAELQQEVNSLRYDNQESED